jgi:hypothetical protein
MCSICAAGERWNEELAMRMASRFSDVPNEDVGVQNEVPDVGCYSFGSLIRHDPRSQESTALTVERRHS